MTFQTTVGRQFTTGFPGDVVRDGPMRAKVARIASDNTDLGDNTISRAFGYNSDLTTLGTGQTTTQAMISQDVVVGGANFFGVLGHRQHYALYGTAQGGSLAPTIVLPKGTEGEFFDMCTGLIVELFNAGTAAQTVNYGDQLAYVSNTITAGDNLQKLPHGAIVALAPGAAIPTGFVAIPNARIIDPTTIAASSPTVLSSTYAIVQLTQ